MNYLVYPCKKMKLTQNHTDGNHARHSVGNPADYPFDECCGDTGRGWFYCPCDNMKVVKKYTAGVNTLWLESTAPVVMPVGTAYVTIMIEHMNDDDMETISVGQTFRRGEKMFREGKDGAAGNHFHISVGTGHRDGGGWSKNASGAWALTVTGRPLKADEAFYLENTEVINAKGYSFKTKPKEVKKTVDYAGHWSEKAIEKAKKLQLMAGDPDGQFRPNSPLTRGEAAQLCANIAKYVDQKIAEMSAQLKGK
ncbi:MAG: S-layer homology domain-containing protein [Clostridia bacterium]|nr:S-layer homology domain-containing protein [Clostridia bacterium]